MAEEKQKKEEKKKKVQAYKPPAKFCPKCGSRMGEHANRFACGRCGYTEWKQGK